MKRLGCGVLIVCALSLHAAPPKPLEDALKAYVAEGAAAFVTTLLKGSPLTADTASQVSALKLIESYYGAGVSWEILDECAIGERVRTTYYVMHLEKGPIFGNTTTYRMASDEEVLTNFLVHTEQAEIFPAGYVGGEVCDE